MTRKKFRQKKKMIEVIRKKEILNLEVMRFSLSSGIRPQILNVRIWTRGQKVKMERIFKKKNRKKNLLCKNFDYFLYLSTLTVL